MNSQAQNLGRGSFYVRRVAFVAAIGGFLFGYDLGVIGAAIPYLKDQFGLSGVTLGFATGSAVLGCLLGPFLGGWLCDTIGRKRTMIVASLLLALSALLTAIPEDIVVFNFFRAIGGLGVGLCSIASPMFIAEVSPPHKRGSLGLMYQLAIVVGHIIAPFVAYFIVQLEPDPTLTWRWMFASEMIFVLVFVTFVLFLPYSPRWLAQKGRYEEAQAVLSDMDGPQNAKVEIAVIKQSLGQETGSLGDFLKPGLRYALLIGLLLAFFNNWTGWSVIAGYIPLLFEMSGVEDRALAILQFATTYFFMGLMTLVSLLLMDRVGRRPLWLVASVMMAVITAIAGAIFHYEITGIWVLVIIMLTTVPHGIALGGIPWLMISEIYPTRIRAKAVAVTTTFLWLTIYSGAQLFPVITNLSERAFLSAAKLSLTSTSVSFVDSNLDVITSSANEFRTSDFRPGQKITVSGSSKVANSGTFTVYAVFPPSLVVSGKTLANEGAGAWVSLVSENGELLRSKTIGFADSNLDLIMDSQKGLSQSGFKTPQRITIKGSTNGLNDKTVTLAEVTDEQILLKSGDSIIEQRAGAEVTLQVGSLGWAFWLFTLVSLLSLVFGMFMMPETKDRNLEEIGASWVKPEPKP